jgi:predicted dehydrogenase
MKRELHKVGKVKLVMGNYSQYSSRYDNVLAGESPNIFNPAFAGGCLMDINFYNVWINVALFGKPESVTYYCNQHERLADTSGVLVMQYPGFVAECVGAKDTWGVNYYQIEGESGYIYAKEGCNKLVEIDVVTKQSGATFNEQEDTDRWYYEVSEITRLVLEGKHEEIDAGLEIMVTVMEIIENARKHVGIFFPGDSEYSEI